MLIPKRLSAIIITVVVTLSVLALGFFVDKAIRDRLAANLTNQYIAQEAKITDQIAGNLENELAAVQDKLRLLALSPTIQSGNTASCNAKLTEAFEVMNSKLGNLGRINAQGNFSCSINAKLIGVPGNKLGSYVTDIFNDPKHEPVLSHAILPPGAGTYATALHVPVFTATKQFDGTLGGAVYLKDIQDKFLKNVSFAENGFVVLFDDNGDILYHPHAELIGKNLDSPEAAKLYGKVDGLRGAIAKAKAGEKGTLNYLQDGQQKVGSYRAANILPNHDWIVLASMPIGDAALALSRGGVDWAFGATFAVLALAIVMLAATFLAGILRSLRLQDKLLQEKATTQIYLSSIGDGVIIIDRHKKVVLLNRAAEGLTGWTATEAVGKPLRSVMKILEENSRKERVGFINGALQHGIVSHMTGHTILIRRDGTEIPVGDSAAPVLSADGEIDGVVVVFRDMAEEKAAAQMKSDFAYASHQFRTPLSQLLSALSMAKDEHDIKVLKEYLAMAQIGAESVHRLTLDLLALSELENKRLQLKSEPIDLPALLAEEVKEVMAKADDKRLKIMVDTEPGLPVVSTDSALLKKVLGELLNNATHYRRAASEIQVRVREEGGQLVIAVHNEGESISKEETPQIFTKFFRGSNRPADVSGGGLGLYLTREYVRLMGGRLWFESNADKTVFRVSLPLSRTTKH